MRRCAAAAQNSTLKKQRQDFVYTKQIKYLQIWAPKTPIKQIKYGSAPSSTNQIKYGLCPNSGIEVHSQQSRDIVLCNVVRTKDKIFPSYSP